jgi:rhamnogalacturonyl hydrolase YesR/predicted dehydrogenase
MTDANTKPLTIGFIGDHSDFQFYAEAFQTISKASLIQIDRKILFQGQTPAVIVAVPLIERAELARHILQFGSHVLVEMPMAVSYQEFDDIIQVANQQNKRVAIINFHRFLTYADQARTVIDEIGKIKKIQIQVSEKRSDPLLSHYREGFIGKGLPLLDLVRCLISQNPSNLQTDKTPSAQFFKPANPLHLSIELGKISIPLSYDTITTLPKLGEWIITIFGQNGTVKLSEKGGLQHLSIKNKIRFTKPPSDYREAVRGLLEDFVAVCQTGREPEVNALDGMASIALTLNAVQSAQCGQKQWIIEPAYQQDQTKIWLQERRQQSRKQRKANHSLFTQLHSLSRTLSHSFSRYRYRLIGNKIQRDTIASRFSQADLYPLEVAFRMARRVMTQYKLYPSYTTDLALEGLLYLFDASGREEYLDHVLKVWQFRAKMNCDSLSWKKLFVGLHFETFLRTKNTRYIETFLEVAKDFRDNVPRDSDGAISNWIRPESQRIFIDMLQGYAIFMARAGWLSGDKSFFDECVEQYQIFRAILCNPQTGLWHQGRGWGPESHFISPGHWNRGQGWVLRGMVESLCYLPESHFNVMRDMMKEFAENLIKYQDARGMWHQLTDNPAAYQETSGTAMLIHDFYKAIHNGWLPTETFLPVVENGLKGLLGFVHKNGLVSNTSHGSAPLMTSEGYLHRPSVPGEPHSIGTTLMACAAPYLQKSANR